MQEKQALTRQQWFDLVEEHKNSGLSQTEFCRQKSLNLCRFGYYIKKTREQTNILATPNLPIFSQVKIEADLNPKQNEIKIELPNGFKCQLSSSIQPEQLKKILGALLSC
jgi:hypothetical protein